jgi:hypothetical protein
MELSSERKLQLLDQASQARQAQTRAEGRQWRKRYLVYVCVIAATLGIATILAHLVQ